MCVLEKHFSKSHKNPKRVNLDRDIYQIEMLRIESVTNLFNVINSSLFLGKTLTKLHMKPGSHAPLKPQKRS